MSFQYYMEAGGTRPPYLFVATTSGSSPKPNYVDALTRTIRALTMVGIETSWLMHQGDPHVDDARNACVAKFLESGAKKFLFIDDDVGWDPDEFLKFINHNRDVVAAVYPKKKDEPDYPVRLIEGPLQAEPDGLLRVENVPTGFLMISRKCIESMLDSAVWFERKDAGKTPLLFERGVTNGIRWSGDYWWGRKWTEAGGTIWVDPEMNLTHVGMKTWEGCFGDYLRDKNKIMDRHLDGAFRLLQSGVVNQHIWSVLAGRCGNFPFCAPEEMMGLCYDMARDARGPVLEIGSGLTTVIMGMAGAEVHTLEHDYAWYKKTRGWLTRYGLTNVHLHYAPIEERDDGLVWYSVPKDLPTNFALVVLDGPPRNVCPRANLFRIIRVSDADWIVDDVDGDPSPYEIGGRTAEVMGRFALIRKPEPVRLRA